MTFSLRTRRGIGALALGTFLASMPVGFHFDGGVDLTPAKALAKDGGSNSGSGGGSGSSGGGGGSSGGGGKGGSGSNSSGGGSGSANSGSGRSGGSDDTGSGTGGDDHGGGQGGSGQGGADDGAGDDHGGRGGADDGAGDDHGNRGGGADDAAVGGGAPVAGGLRVVKFERTATGVEIVYSNGIKDEIENGRFERKNPAGRTILERPATQQDVDRLEANARNPGVARVPAGRTARTVEVNGAAVEVNYANGWKEELAGGRYELQDPDGNTVVERAATADDIHRLRGLTGS